MNIRPATVRARRPHGRGSTAVSLLLALTLAISACTSLIDSPSGVVERWLAAMPSSSGDRGWSLLHPDTRDAQYGGQQSAYVSKASRADWSGFEWQVLDRTHEVHPGWFLVSVRVARPELLPRFLLEDHLVQLVTDQEPSVVTVLVRFGAGKGVYRPPK